MYLLFTSYLLFTYIYVCLNLLFQWICTYKYVYTILSVCMYVCMYACMHLCIYASIHLSIYLSIHLSIHASIHKSLYLSTYPSIYLSIHPSIYLSIDLSIYLFVCLSVCLSVCLPTCKLENAAILRDFLSFWTWQHQKRNKSARLPQFLNLTTSKTKKSARLPQFSKLKTSKTKEFCETSFKNGKLSAELTASCHCILRLFHSICLKYCACHEKVMPGQTKCCTCHAKSSQQAGRSDAPKCNPSQEISTRTS